MQRVLQERPCTLFQARGARAPRACSVTYLVRARVTSRYLCNVACLLNKSELMTWYHSFDV